MRMLICVKMPNDSFKAAVRDGIAGRRIQKILEDPETRSGLLHGDGGKPRSYFAAGTCRSVEDSRACRAVVAIVQGNRQDLRCDDARRLGEIGNRWNWKEVADAG
jgi:hypothetical protein